MPRRADASPFCRGGAKPRGSAPLGDDGQGQGAVGLDGAALEQHRWAGHQRVPGGEDKT